MSKRVCQTCRHFRAAGFDNMGWCNHPRRRGGTEVKLLARSLELQCRNDWDQDLWQGLAEGESTSFAIDRVVAPMRPVTPGEIATIAALENRTRLDEGGGEDVVVAEVTPRFSSNKAAAQGDGFKVGISKAHEEVRSRHRAVRDAVLPVSNLSDVPGGLTAEQSEAMAGAQTPDTDGEVNLSSPHAGQPRPIIGEVSPVALGEMGRPFPKLTTFPEDDEIFSSIPKTVEGFDLPFVTKAAPERTIKRAGFDEDDREIRPWNHGADLVAEVAETSESAIHADGPSGPARQADHVADPVDSFPRYEMRPRIARDEVVIADEAAMKTDAEIQRPQSRGARRSSPGEFNLSVFDLTSLEPEPAAPVRPERLSPRPNRATEWSADSTDRVVETIRASERDELVLEERSVLRPARSRQIERVRVTETIQAEPILDEIDIETPPVRLPRPKRERRETTPEIQAHVAPVSPTADGRRVQRERPADRTPSVERDDIHVIESVAERFYEDDSYQEPVRRSGITQRAHAVEFSYESDPVGAAPEASIPRMCKTCRDFRPAESGERGWCNNKWAFTHRRMVDAEEMPCETTIGRWWLPHDDHWATAVDISNHSRPTPFLDQWLAQRAEANGEIDTAPPIRRRHRS